MKTKAVLGASLVAACVCAAADRSSATTLTFDQPGLTVNGDPTPVAQGYGGLDWNRFYVVAAANEGGGFANGMESSPNVVYDGYNGINTAASITSTQPFTLDSAYFTAAYDAGLSVTVTGMTETGQYSKTFTVQESGNTVPTLETFDWSGLLSVDFSSSFGGKSGQFTQFVMDNMTITPTPLPRAAWAGVVLLVCVGGCGVRRRKRRLAVA